MSLRLGSILKFNCYKKRRTGSEINFGRHKKLGLEGHFRRKMSERNHKAELEGTLMPLMKLLFT